MAAPLQGYGDYEHVLSEDVVSEIRRLLQVETRSNSLVLRGDLDRAAGLIGLRGLGREIWAGDDAQEYVRRLRDEWD